ncbi:hypothetical protein [Streptomyces phaeofaciens]|uniref:hypothetical protein n=1 Tax=Streptomyces phaeofaciens TaxID=68254 RepID=UPI0016729060|nr:hypothetical protein [Streptomyces phaeofaciens]
MSAAPRASEDGPKGLVGKQLGATCSPRERGQSHQVHVHQVTDLLFSPCVRGWPRHRQEPRDGRLLLPA